MGLSPGRDMTARLPDINNFLQAAGFWLLF